MNTPTQADHTRWFSEEIQPHEHSLRAYLRVRFPAIGDLDDLVQESYARIIRARNRGPIASPKSLLFATARNAALDVFRRRQSVSIEPVADFDRLRLVMEAPNAAESASRAQESELLREAICALPDRCRQVITLRMIYGLRHKEIAQRLAITENTVNNHLAIALERCRQFLTARGVNRAR